MKNGIGWRALKIRWRTCGIRKAWGLVKGLLTNGVVTAGNRLFKSTKNDYKNELNMFTCFGLFFEILNLLKIIYFNSDKM